MSYRRLRPARLALVAALALTACGQDAEAPQDETAVNPAPGGAAGFDSGYSGSAAGGGGGGGGRGGGAGGGSAENGDDGSGGVSIGGGAKIGPQYTDRDEHLRFQAIPRLYDVDRGRPMLVDLVLNNVGTEPVRLVRPARDLAENFTLRVKSGSKVFTMRKRGWSPEDAGPHVKVETLEPGMSIATTVDLLPMLRDTPGYVAGGVKFTVEYRGAAELAPSDGGLWNADGRGSLVTSDIFMEVIESSWLTRYESDPEALRAHQADAINAARAWSPTHPKQAEMLAAFRAKGEVALACLCQLVERMELPEPESYELAGKAAAMVRQLSTEALPLLRRAQAETAHPARTMLLNVLEEDERVRQKLAPSAGLAAVRDLGAGAETGSLLEIAVRGGTPNPVEFRLLPDGKLSVRRQKDGKPYEFTVSLAPRQWVQLKTELIERRIWSWQGVRTSTLPEEGDVEIVISPKSGATQRIRMPEFEARKSNPFAAPVFRMFDELANGVEAPPSAAVQPADAPAPPK